MERGMQTQGAQWVPHTCPYLHKCVQREDVLPSDVVELDHGTLQERAIGKVIELGLPFHTSDCQEVSLRAPLGHHLWNHKEKMVSLKMWLPSPNFPLSSLKNRDTEQIQWWLLPFLSWRHQLPISLKTTRTIKNRRLLHRKELPLPQNVTKSGKTTYDKAGW